jgi:16S rRNA (cytosine967-C5)-methyltransferase
MPRHAVRRLDARTLALEILIRVETTDAFADVLLGERLAGAALGADDAALATRLVYGAIAWQGRLDHHLQGLLRRPLAGLEPAVRAALRLGLYQLLFLDRIPAYAAVDASVDLARDAGRGAVGLVNAVLRRAVAVGQNGLPLPPKSDPLARVSVEWSHPRWLVERWATEFGADELVPLLAANNARLRTAVRAHRHRTTRAALLDELTAVGVTASASTWADDGLVIEHGAARLRGIPAWHEGRFAFQSEAAQLVAPLLAPSPGARLLDACAAPGGKTGHLAALCERRGLLVALDARATGIRRVRDEALRLGAEIAALAADARRPPLRATFDGVLVDAPCSGLGTLSRHPEVRWRRRPADVPRLALLQRELLAGVAPLVRPGGLLVYAVCTLTHDENEAVVDWLLRTHPRFTLDHAARDGGAPGALVTPGGFLRTLPHRDRLDGFFAARLRARA